MMMCRRGETNLISDAYMHVFNPQSINQLTTHTLITAAQPNISRLIQESQSCTITASR